MRVPSLVTSGRVNDLLRLIDKRHSSRLPDMRFSTQRSRPSKDSLQTEPSAFIPHRLRPRRGRGWRIPLRCNIADFILDIRIVQHPLAVYKEAIARRSKRRHRLAQPQLQARGLDTPDTGQRYDALALQMDATHQIGISRRQTR